MTNTPGDEIYKDSEELKGPRTAKGGAIAPADIPLIKEALVNLVQALGEDDPKVTHAASLLHRLGRIS